MTRGSHIVIIQDPLQGFLVIIMTSQVLFLRGGQADEPLATFSLSLSLATRQ